MTPVYQTRNGAPHGNCFAACVASILDKKIEDVDIDVASCNKSVFEIMNRLQEKANCSIHFMKSTTISKGIVTTSERYCCVEVCSFVYCGDPYGEGSLWHVVVCEIGEGGKLSLVFNPDAGDQRTRLEDFPALCKLFIVKANP